MKKKIIKAIVIFYGIVMGIGLFAAITDDSENPKQSKASSIGVVQETQEGERIKTTEPIKKATKKVETTEPTKKVTKKAETIEPTKKPTKKPTTSATKKATKNTPDKAALKALGDVKYDIFWKLSQDSPKYALVSDTKKLIKGNPLLFPTTNFALLRKKVNYDVTIKHINKAPYRYHGEIVMFPNYEVAEIYEYNEPDITIIRAIGEGNVLYIHYLGHLKNVLEDSVITCFGVPADVTYYKNVMGGKTKCCVVLANYIEDYSNIESFITAVCSFSDPPDLEEYEYDEYFREEYNAWLKGEGYYNIKQKKDGTFYCTD